MTYALDTNTLIYLLRKDEGVIEKRNNAIRDGCELTIPPTVDYEIRRGLLYRPSPRKEKTYLSLLLHYDVGIMTPEMWVKSADIYVELRKKGFSVGDNDIFIAAFCLLNDYTLVTRNTKDFENIAGLRQVNWIDN
ncbi:MAG: PIN domain-containing protein [Defluviitaleaceae bacterium]|nr:PIN domain-containing protein [Defluviitaleaceae bacterium]